MPSKTERQRKFMGAELSREREGEKTKTGMSESQLEDFASKPIEKSRLEDIHAYRKKLYAHLRNKDPRPIKENEHLGAAWRTEMREKYKNKVNKSLTDKIDLFVEKAKVGPQDKLPRKRQPIAFQTTYGKVGRRTISRLASYQPKMEKSIPPNNWYQLKLKDGRLVDCKTEMEASKTLPSFKNEEEAGKYLKENNLRGSIMKSEKIEKKKGSFHNPKKEGVNKNVMLKKVVELKRAIVFVIF